MTKSRPKLEAVRWKEIRESAYRVNPEFSKVIDAVSPSGELVLYKASYPFGSIIIQESQFYIPHTDGTLITFDDPRMNPKIKEKLAYNTSVLNSIPLSLALKHSVELFIDVESHTIPFFLKKQGSIFGLYGFLGQSIFYDSKIWHMTAGAHSFFVLPKMMDEPSYKKLSKARGLRQPLPRNLLSQSKMLQKIAQHKDFGDDWCTEILYFPKEFLENRQKEAWTSFYLYIYDIAWNFTDYMRSKPVYDYIWNCFIQGLMQEDVRVSAQVIDIVKHLILIVVGEFPAFCPALDDDTAPVAALQKDLVKYYGFKSFAPTIMVLRHLVPGDSRYLYWSLQYPTHFESIPRLKTPMSTLGMLREVKRLLERFCDSVLEGKIPVIKDTAFYNLFKRVEFDFFHSEADLQEGIRPSSVMPKEDPTLIECAQKFKQKGFSDVSPFVRGCIRIKLN